MSRYVLVHGAWHGAWCWERVLPLLREAGHAVLAPDLPAHGDDPTPAAAASLEGYAARVCDALDAAPEPAVLVGHSLAGAIVSQAAEYRPERVRALVYLAAPIPGDGDALVSGRMSERIRSGLRASEDGTTVALAPDAARAALYADCAPGDLEGALSRLRPEPAAPFGATVRLSDARFGRVPRVYVECRADGAVTLAQQREIQRERPCERVLGLDAGHAPFLSAPAALAAHLLAV